MEDIGQAGQAAHSKAGEEEAVPGSSEWVVAFHSLGVDNPGEGQEQERNPGEGQGHNPGEGQGRSLGVEDLDSNLIFIIIDYIINITSAVTLLRRRLMIVLLRLLRWPRLLRWRLLRCYTGRWRPGRRLLLTRLFCYTT